MEIHIPIRSRAPVRSVVPISVLAAAVFIAGCSGVKSAEEKNVSSPPDCRQGLDCGQNVAPTPRQQLADFHHVESAHTLKIEPNGGYAAGVTILDAAFTDRIVNRQPEHRITSWSLKERGSRAWLWVKVHCTGPCLKKLTPNGKARLTVHWYMETDRGFVKQYSANLSVKGEEWRTWAIKRDLVPGKWKVTIVADTGRVCLKQEGKCEFFLQVVS